jgi:hypothetical protein
VQVSVLGGLEGLHRQHVVHGHPHLPSRFSACGLLAGIARPLPRDQHSALAQQRRRVLHKHGQRPQRAGCDRVVGLAAAPDRSRHAGELLRARGYGARVGHVARLDQPVHHRRLSSHGLDEVNLRLRQSHGQSEARKPCTCAYIRNPPRPAERWNLQPAQAVRHVNLQRCLRLAHRGVGIRLSSQRLENPLDLARGGLSEPVAGY